MKRIRAAGARSVRRAQIDRRIVGVLRQAAGIVDPFLPSRVVKAAAAEPEQRVTEDDDVELVRGVERAGIDLLEPGVGPLLGCSLLDRLAGGIDPEVAAVGVGLQTLVERTVVTAHFED